MTRTLRTRYTSGLFTVTLPLLIFLAVWAGVYFLPILLGWPLSDWTGLLLCGAGVVLGLLVSVVTYSLLMKGAERGRGEVMLEGTVLRWRSGRRWRQLDLAGPHRADIAADSRSTGLYLEDDRGQACLINLFFHQLPRQETLGLFPAPHFVQDLVVSPYMGSWGFEASATDPEVRDFAVNLLRILWEHRQQNGRFLLYAKFPWDHTPQPAFHHVRLIEWEKRTPEEEAFIQGLESQFIDGLTDSCVRLTPDYLVGWVYRSVRSHWTGWPDFYCLMPLGDVRAEVSLPQPDWKPFIVGRVLREALATVLGGGTTTGGPYLEDKYYLYVRGRDEKGKQVEMAFDWPYARPAHQKYEEAKMVVRFVEAMRERAGSGGER